MVCGGKAVALAAIVQYLGALPFVGCMLTQSPVLSAQSPSGRVEIAGLIVRLHCPLMRLAVAQTLHHSFKLRSILNWQIRCHVPARFPWSWAIYLPDI
jgi:hypothetical protein